MSDFARTYPVHPIPCAAAIIMEADRVLLIQRGREPNYGQWSFPGGAVELGETTEGCALRETHEETGLEIAILDVAAVVDRVFKDENDQIHYHYVIVDYLAHPVGGTLQAATDVLAAKWVSFDEAFAYDLAPPTADVLRKAIDKWELTQTSPASASSPPPG
jgi:ADP-ribose pyrophosphatase YjhB (NUDIX family)